MSPAPGGAGGIFHRRRNGQSVNARGAAFRMAERRSVHLDVGGICRGAVMMPEFALVAASAGVLEALSPAALPIWHALSGQSVVIQQAPANSMR